MDDEEYKTFLRRHADWLGESIKWHREQIKWGEGQVERLEQMRRETLEQLGERTQDDAVGR